MAQVRYLDARSFGALCMGVGKCGCRCIGLAAQRRRRCCHAAAALVVSRAREHCPLSQEPCPYREAVVIPHARQWASRLRRFAPHGNNLHAVRGAGHATTRGLVWEFDTVFECGGFWGFWAAACGAWQQAQNGLDSKHQAGVLLVARSRFIHALGAHILNRP